MSLPPRNYADWLTRFIDYASIGEAPRRMYFWVGVSAIAGALRRKIWLDLGHFKWYPNFYIVLTAPPGIVAKSTTAGISSALLRAVPGIKFGPDVVTWPALVTSFAENGETFLWNEEHHVMSALNLEASEFGNLLNPQDREMVDLFVSLWDGKQGAFEKKTKNSGNDTIQNPWINMIACTTPAWIAGNFPEYMIGGGFTSRCIFVYADKKEKYIAYPDQSVPEDFETTRYKLVQDLERISLDYAGPFHLSPAARAFGESWYRHHYSVTHEHLDDMRFGGYLARKQTHVHKLAMILAVSRGSEMIIERSDLETAIQMVTDLELDMAKVFAKIGQSDASITADRLIAFVRTRGKVPYMQAYRAVHAQVPSIREFDDMLSGCIRADYLQLHQEGATMFVVSAEYAAANLNKGKIIVPGSVDTATAAVNGGGGSGLNNVPLMPRPPPLVEKGRAEGTLSTPAPNKELLMDPHYQEKLLSTTAADPAPQPSESPG